MKLFPPLAFFILAIGIAAFVAKQSPVPNPGPAPIFESSILVGSTRVEVEIADSPHAMKLGLGGRDSLPANRGMLFVYSQKTPAVFWMKGMRFPLDIIWIADGKVVQIDEKVPAEPGVAEENLKTYVSGEPVDMVLEVNAGFSDENNIKIGDSVIFIDSKSGLE